MGMTSGQIFGSVGGAIIGSFFGPVGMFIGMSLGGLIGGWLDPPDAPKPPKYGNLGVNSYVHNAPVPINYGQNKLYGGNVWIGDVETMLEESGSKTASALQGQMWIMFAVAHCEGEVQGYTGRYWIDDRVMPDPNDGMRFTFRSYNGSATQAIDPNIGADLAGSANPAVPFKYTAYSFVSGFFSEGFFNTIPTASAEVIGFLTESGEEDANPIRCLYDFLTDTRYGLEMPISLFDGDPDTIGSSWAIASDYCDELVDYVDENNVTISEPRFRYSNEFDTRVKGYDIVKDMLQTCRGIVAYCQGLIYVKIENESEDVSGYFSDEYTVPLTSGGGCTVNRIYFTVAIEEPDGFWEGAYLNFVVDDITYSEMINLQGSNYVDLVDNLVLAPDSGIAVSLTKDNIKEGSFNWNKTSSAEKPNSCRVEFVNRKTIIPPSSTLTNNYIWDVVENDQPEAYLKVYSGEHTIGDYNQKQVRLKGVKRKSQAMRMCRFFSDFGSYVQYYCEFVTDIVGYLFKVGDIIGVSHSTLGWQAKEFRIVSLEEVNNDEIKFSCLEYSRYLYGDDILQVFNTTAPSPGDSVYVTPDDVERVHVVQDLNGSFVWINYKRPDNNNWWMGAQVWLRRGVSGEYTNVGQFARATSSVELLGAIDNIQTVIPFSSATLYGTFPDSGSFWIEDELITYTSIDETNNEFEGCTRGVNATAHASDEYCHLRESSLPTINYYNSDVGITWFIKVVSVNVAGITSDFASATEVSLIIT